MHVDMACQLCQSRRSPPFIRKDFTGAFQPSGAFARGLQSVFGGRIQQFGPVTEVMAAMQRAAGKPPGPQVVSVGRPAPVQGAGA